MNPNMGFIGALQKSRFWCVKVEGTEIHLRVELTAKAEIKHQKSCVLRSSL